VICLAFVHNFHALVAGTVAACRAHSAPPSNPSTPRTPPHPLHTPRRLFLSLIPARKPTQTRIPSRSRCHTQTLSRQILGQVPSSPASSSSQLLETSQGTQVVDPEMQLCLVKPVNVVRVLFQLVLFQHLFEVCEVLINDWNTRTPALPACCRRCRKPSN
jgi:hypothetical protein